MKKLTILIPCYNEEKGIGKVIEAIPKEKLESLGYQPHVLVIDNNSKDKTSDVARHAGAHVIFEKKQGKGHAIRTGIRSIPQDTDIVVMLDGDNSYRPQEMLRLIEPLDNGFSDVAIGTRLGGRIIGGSMPTFNRAGNWFFTFLVRTCYQGNVTDVCTGYFAWKKEVLTQLAKYLESDGFSIEMEMITKMARMNFEIISVPITYKKRAGESHLKPFGDGKKILHAWMRNLFWQPYAKHKGS